MNLKNLLTMPVSWPQEYGRYYSAVRFTVPITVMLHAALVVFFAVIRVREMVLYNIASTLWWSRSFLPAGTSGRQCCQTS